MLTSAQYATLKASILADPTLSAASDTAIADAYNLAAVPAAKLWRPSIAIAELNTVLQWTDYVALTAVKQNAYMAMTQAGEVDSTEANVRQGFIAIFGAGSPTINNFLALAQKEATRFEVTLSSAPVAGARVSEVFGQLLTPADVSIALRNT